ncbi:hypothetical protein DM02DRAFT_627900 [Periconia macrospinosa]|uniref:Uncharacterized protein n=1 Tax=Periconia macrospinosa TaxID=97972 RepID=A0A2V1DSU4_9PLEO|nr:hypothetical protein DM02DRAFT_627900 [Periconia macrospinosa]
MGRRKNSSGYNQYTVPRSPFDPEQASMFRIGSLQVHDCRSITNFTWQSIEQRINELSDHRLLRNSPSGEPQRLPWRSFANADNAAYEDNQKEYGIRRRRRQFEIPYVIAVSLNNYACENNLDLQFGLCQQFDESGTNQRAGGPTIASELYVVQKPWTDDEKALWKTSTAITRHHWVSIDHGLGFHWSHEGLPVLRVPLHSPRDTKALMKKEKDFEDLDNDRHQVHVPYYSDWFRQYLKSHAHLVVQRSLGRLMIFIARPGQLRAWRKGAEGTLRDSQRCYFAEDIVAHLNPLLTRTGKRDLREVWINVRAEREDACPLIFVPHKPLKVENTIEEEESGDEESKGSSDMCAPDTPPTPASQRTKTVARTPSRMLSTLQLQTPHKVTSKRTHSPTEISSGNKRLRLDPDSPSKGRGKRGAYASSLPRSTPGSSLPRSTPGSSLWTGRTLRSRGASKAQGQQRNAQPDGSASPPELASSPSESVYTPSSPSDEEASDEWANDEASSDEASSGEGSSNEE